MLGALPIQFWWYGGGRVALMAASAFFMGAPLWWQRGLARSMLVVGGAGLFVITMTYVSVIAAVIVVCLPILIVIAFFTNLFEGWF